MSVKISEKRIKNDLFILQLHENVHLGKTHLEKYNF